MSTSSGWIYLNVGGYDFFTTRLTLEVIPYFSNYFARWNDRNNSKESPIMIDQDGESFSHILKWCRNPNYCFPKEIQINFDFWGIDEDDIDYCTPSKYCIKCGVPATDYEFGQKCIFHTLHKTKVGEMSECMKCGEIYYNNKTGLYEPKQRTYEPTRILCLHDFV